MTKVLFVHEDGYPVPPPPYGMAFEVSRIQVTIGQDGPITIYSTTGILHSLPPGVANYLGQAL